LGQSLDEYPCPSSTVFSHFFNDEFGLTKPNQLLVVFNGSSDHLTKLLKNWRQLPACHSATNVDLLLHGFAQAPNVDDFDLLYQCFRSILFLPTTSSDGENPDNLALLHVMKQDDLIIHKYNYLFWMGENLIPVAPNWVNFLEKETNDATPFFWKSSLNSLQDVHSYLQRLYGFMPTGHALRLDKHAFIGIWHEGFAKFLRTLMESSTHQSSSFDTIFSSFLFQRKCHYKFFMHRIRYSSFSRPAVLGNTSIVHPQIFIDKSQKLCSKIDLNEDPGNIFYWFSKKESSQPLSMSEVTNLMWETGHMVSGPASAPNLYSWKKEEYLMSREEQKMKELMGEDCLIENPRNEVSTYKPPVLPVDKKIRILVAMVFYRRQYATLLYSLARWEYPKLYPCSGAERNFETGIMFLQSDLESDIFSPEKIQKDTKHYRSLSTCFDKKHYRSVVLPDGGYDFGPPNMFREIILGPVSDGYDYVFQIEPDVIPIRMHWLDKLFAETLDNSPFWVKGSFALYYDPLEPYGGCLTGTAMNETHGMESCPLGPRLLHINGNALYSLGPEFKNIVEQFFEWGKTSAGCMCARNDRLLCLPSGHCRGSFDTSLAEFLLLNAASMERSWPNYRGSDFIVNSIDPTYLPMCISENTYFMHKPWHFFKDKKGTACQKKLRGTFLLNELEVYLHSGFPPEAVMEKHSNGRSISNPKAVLSFVKQAFDQL